MIQSEGPPGLEDLSCSVTLYHAILLYFYMMFKIIVLNLFIRYSQGAENWKASLWTGVITLVRTQRFMFDSHMTPSVTPVSRGAMPSSGL